MATQLWSLAVAQLVVYLIFVPLILYIAFRHRHQAILGWFFLFAFLTLQIVGSGIVVSAGQHGSPSETAVIILEVGISTLILGIAGGIVEFMRFVGIFNNGNRKLVIIGEVVFHIAVATAISLYAVGASDLAEDKSKNDASSAGIEKAGILLLVLLWVVLCAALGGLWGLAAKSGKSCAPLLGALVVSLVLLGIRVLFRCVATFDDDPRYQLVGGDIVYSVVLNFLPSVGIVAAMAVGGLMTCGWELPEKSVSTRRDEMERSSSDGKSTVV